VRKASAK
ncbi:acrB/AcrD/AcrF family protein, partial [Vibrio parahaemolyticus AQ3810]